MNYEKGGKDDTKETVVSPFGVVYLCEGGKKNGGEEKGVPRAVGLSAEREVETSVRGGSLNIRKGRGGRTCRGMPPGKKKGPWGSRQKKSENTYVYGKKKGMWAIIHLGLRGDAKEKKGQGAGWSSPRAPRAIHSLNPGRGAFSERKEKTGSQQTRYTTTQSKNGAVVKGEQPTFTHHG